MNKVIKNVMLGTFMMLLLGIVYTYSVLRIEIEEVYNVDKLASGVPYMTSLFFYALFMAVGGILLTRYNTKTISIVGSLLIASGFLLSSVAHHIYIITIGYGVLAGTGTGLLYGIPLRIISNSGHKRIGLLMGVSLLGFGLSTLIFAPIVNALLASRGIETTFLILGIAYLIILLPLSIVYAKEDTKEKVQEKLHYPVLKQKKFYLLYALFFISTFIGLTFIGFTGNVGKELVGLNSSIIAILMGLFAVFNGIGRPLFGSINDAIGFRKTATISLISIIIMTIIHYLFPNNLVVFISSFIVFYINFGGWLSLVPSTTIKLFGKEDYSKNYGLMFTAYGVGALIGNLSGGYLAETFELKIIFLLMTGIALIGLLLVQTQFKET